MATRQRKVDPVLAARAQLALAYHKSRNTPPEEIQRLRSDLYEARINRLIKEAGVTLSADARQRLAKHLTRVRNG